jgi:hypothetical protein
MSTSSETQREGEHEKRLKALFDEIEYSIEESILWRTLRITAISHNVILKLSKHKL